MWTIIKELPNKYFLRLIWKYGKPIIHTTQALATGPVYAAITNAGCLFSNIGLHICRLC
jgi:hypothetical protein